MMDWQGYIQNIKLFGLLMLEISAGFFVIPLQRWMTPGCRLHIAVSWPPRDLSLLVNWSYMYQLDSLPAVVLAAHEHSRQPTLRL